MIYTYISLYNYCCKDVSVTWRSSKNGPSFFVLHNQAKINPFAKSSLKPTQMLNFAQVVETLVTSPTLGVSFGKKFIRALVSLKSLQTIRQKKA